MAGRCAMAIMIGINYCPRLAGSSFAAASVFVLLRRDKLEDRSAVAALWRDKSVSRQVGIDITAPAWLSSWLL
jgi:hypothetical protein